MRNRWRAAGGGATMMDEVWSRAVCGWKKRFEVKHQPPISINAKGNERDSPSMATIRCVYDLFGALDGF